MNLTEAKRLVAQSQTADSLEAAVVDLTLAVKILLGLVEGHRHHYFAPLDSRLGPEEFETGPMQARE